jgi:hypothetical protein
VARAFRGSVLSKATLADKVKDYFRARARGRKWYKRADRLLEELAKEMLPGERVQLNERTWAVLVDRHAKKFVVYNVCGFRRYDLEIEEL